MISVTQRLRKFPNGKAHTIWISLRNFWSFQVNGKQPWFHGMVWFPRDFNGGGDCCKLEYSKQLYSWRYELKIPFIHKDLVWLWKEKTNERKQSDSKRKYYNDNTLTRLLGISWKGISHINTNHLKLELLICRIASEHMVHTIILQK